MGMEKGDHRPECCRDMANLERHDNTTNPRVYLLRCKVCGRNHYHFMAAAPRLQAPGEHLVSYTASSIQGWMSDDALQWLYAQACGMASIVEVGSWKGRSTHALLSGCPGPVFAVDHFQGNPDENHPGGQHYDAQQRDIFTTDFWPNVGHFKNLVVFRMPSVEAAQFFAPKSVDMVFIDGCHLQDAVMADLKAWEPKCRKLLCGHDASYHSVQKAIDECDLPFNEVPGIGIWRIDINGTT